MTDEEQKKNKTVILRLNSVLETQLTELAENLGASYAEVFRIALRELHKKTFKDYIEVQKNRAKMNENLDPMEKEQRKIDQGEMRKDLKAKKIYDAGMKICQLLEGEHSKEGDYDYCKFELFEYMNPNYIHRGFMTLPFDELNDDLLKLKWKGGKEKIMEVLERQKKEVKKIAKEK